MPENWVIKTHLALLHLVITSEEGSFISAPLRTCDLFMVIFPPLCGGTIVLRINWKDICKEENIWHEEDNGILTFVVLTVLHSCLSGLCKKRCPAIIYFLKLEQLELQNTVWEEIFNLTLKWKFWHKSQVAFDSVHVRTESYLILAQLSSLLSNSYWKINFHKTDCIQYTHGH